MFSVAGRGRPQAEGDSLIVGAVRIAPGWSVTDLTSRPAQVPDALDRVLDVIHPEEHVYGWSLGSGADPARWVDVGDVIALRTPHELPVEQ